MIGLQTFARLQPTKRRLVLRTFLVVILIRIGLHVLPFRRLQRYIDSWRHPPCPMPPQAPVTDLVWAVRAVSRRVPSASCLTQSLALDFLLARAGYPSQVRIGVAKDSQTGFQAHAWVVCAGSTLLNAPSEVQRFETLFAMGDKRA
jgi:Transglutaminase-like superfamily